MLKNFILFSTHKFIFVTDICKLIYFHCFSTIIISKDIVIDVFAATRGLLFYIFYCINNLAYTTFIIEWLEKNKSYSKINNSTAIIALREVAEMFGIISTKNLQKLLIDYGTFRRFNINFFNTIYDKIKKYCTLNNFMTIIMIFVALRLIYKLILFFCAYFL